MKTAGKISRGNIKLSAWSGYNFIFINVFYSKKYVNLFHKYIIAEHYINVNEHTKNYNKIVKIIKSNYSVVII